MSLLLRSNPSPLQLLIDEIKFQQQKELQFSRVEGSKDVGGFLTRGTTYWTDVFVRHFLFQQERSIDGDDLLFFVRKKHIRTMLTMPKFQTEVEVFRKDSKKLPVGDPEIEWQETVFLNLIIHQIEYTLTLAICTRTSPKDLQVLKRHSQKVYASPSRRRMDIKGDFEEITYPYVSFMVDNFDEVYSEMTVRDGEMVCVELVALDKGCGSQVVLFLGSIRYDALKRVYDSRASLGSKMAQKMSFGFFGSSATRIEYVRLRGPHDKGHAEIAVSKPKGAGVETPTSEPGFSMTDGLWDSDNESDSEDFMLTHHRRLSDPSSNLTNYTRNTGWRKSGMDNPHRTKSQSEGLDYCGVAEIEAGDLRDDEGRRDWSCCPCPPPREMCRLPRSRSLRLDEIPLKGFSRRNLLVPSRTIEEEPTEGPPVLAPKSSSICCLQEAKFLCRQKMLHMVPNKMSSTGVRIFYFCILENEELQNSSHKIDDSAYNPIWTMRGNTQSFHFWRENRRAQSIPLNAYLTYISLPAAAIMKDILENREEPVLTF